VITGRQIRAARALLGWSREKLCQETGMSWSTLARLEQGGADPRVSTVEAVQAALEHAGIEFISGEGKGEGVRLTRPG
jgi:predicted transcriptional regulator